MGILLDDYLLAVHDVGIALLHLLNLAAVEVVDVTIGHSVEHALDCIFGSAEVEGLDTASVIRIEVSAVSLDLRLSSVRPFSVVNKEETNKFILLL